ncbi:hypothetical protein Barb4_02948 [Bacteroidales bacterium Barb4]|nr:hypothetical protein Barb4_02948 [Bacteroidales bacterium Barb4]
MPRRGERFQPHMQRSEMWGLRTDTVREALQGWQFTPNRV